MTFSTKRLPLAALSFFFGFALSCSVTAPANSSSATLRPTDLLKSPQSYLNRNVEIEIIEPLSGPATPQSLATAEYGKVRVEIPDALGTELALVPVAFRVEDPNRYKKKFDRVVEGPLRVKGEFLTDPELSKDLHRPVYLIRVSSWEPIARETPISLPPLAEVKADPGKWDRKRVTYEGIYETRFEVAALDKEIWLAFEPHAEMVGKAVEVSPGRRLNRVRVTGTFYAKPGVRFGHLGGYPYEILASKLEYLGAAPQP